MKKAILIVPVSCIIGLSIATAQKSKSPRYVTYSLAGTNIQKLRPMKEETALYDKSKGYYLVKNCPQGSTERQLLLTPPEDLKDDPDETLSRVTVRRGTLPSLSTSNGVKIGDNPQQVISKLGLPTEHNADTEGEPEKTGNGTYLYYYPGGYLNGYSYESWYRFRKGHLRTISIAMQKGREVAG